MNLSQWKESGLQLIKALRERGEEKAFRRLLSDLYPDKAHFIYELFQNAEDSKAELCSFTLTESDLEFEHNGARLFSIEDVKAITSFGNSTKRDDPTSIGKFGVGFKAVFAYTNTPEIHSGEFHFRIHDLVVPETHGVSEPAMKDRETRFVFPFDHPTKHPAQAVDEVERALRALGDNTLLFLNHIRRIEYTLPDGSAGSLERLDHDDGHIEIRSRHPGGKDTVSHWLRFQKEVKVKDEGNTKPYQIGIAFSLVKEDDTKKRQTNWKIVPLDHGQVSIYFPAEKETSNLRFHIHAPFASTVARDSVRDCEANRQLRDRIAERVVESLADIRDRGMLTMGFLAVLPNRTDNLPAFYEPIREAIVRAFKYERLTPTKKGTYALANALFRGPVKISDVIGDEDLSFLTNCAPPLWAANPPQQSQREDRFLDSLEIDSWGWSELSGALSTVDENNRKPIENWIAQKDDAWLMRFYALLGEPRNDYYKPVEAKNLRIIRVEVGQGHKHVKPHEAFFPPESKTAAPQDVLFVKPAVYSTGRSDAQKKLFAKSFLERVGVRPFDAKAVVELRLAHYNLPSEKVEDYHYKDIEQFVAYWKNNPADAEIFRNKILLLGIDVDGNLHWRKPRQLCLDAPYEEIGLADLSHIHGQSELSDIYKKKLPESMLKDFIDFVKSAGVMHVLNVERVSLAHNPHIHELRQDYYRYRVKWTSTVINEDYSISGIEQYLAAQSVQASRLIWDAIIRADRESASARFRPNQQYPTRKSKSILICHLIDHAWIPDQIGVFRKPMDMTRNDLRADFPFDDRNGLLTAIGFGERAKKRSEVYQAKDQAARALGFASAEVAEELGKLAKESGKSLDELRSLLAQPQRVSQPEESVPNPERRRKGVLERRDNAPTKESVTRERTIQLMVNETFEAKAYLRTKYKNSEGQLICQCCHDEMPFKVGEEYYFEAVQCVRGLGHHYSENRLALCPTCAAMYQHARETDDNEISRSIIEHEAPDTVSSAEITVRLAGRFFQLRFVGTHWFDLKTVLSKEDDLLQDFISTI